MEQSQAADKRNVAYLVSAAGGAILGACLFKNHFDESRKSRAERDDPDAADEVCEETEALLDSWEPNDLEDEESYTIDLAQHLGRETEWEVEVNPGSPEGRPDILLGDLLALEVKLSPT